MHPPDRIIIDTDPGVDDAIAILMALAGPGLEVLGLTAVGGNVSLARATRNSLALLEYAGRTNVSVFRGAARPLRGRFPYSHHFHGASGLTRRLPQPRTAAAQEKAVDFLAGQLQRYPGQVTLVALGPLTNLARLRQREPAALSNLEALVVMGGAVNVPGNVTAHAEFNFYCDPLAAREVLCSGTPLTLVDLGACRRVCITREAAAHLSSQHPLGRLVVQLLNNWFGRDPKRTRFEFYDPLTLAAALDPSLLDTRQVTALVEIEDAEKLGKIRVVAEGGPVSVVEGVDQGRCFGMFRELLGLEGLEFASPPGRT